MAIDAVCNRDHTAHDEPCNDDDSNDSSYFDLQRRLADFDTGQRHTDTSKFNPDSCCDHSRRTGTANHERARVHHRLGIRNIALLPHDLVHKNGFTRQQ
jgi:hypothetical protein